MKPCDSIDIMPVFNWFKVFETMDLRWLYPVRTLENCPKKPKWKELPEVWNRLNDQFVDTFGITDNYRKLLVQKRKLMLMQIDIAVDKKKHLEAVMKVEKRKLDRMETPTEKTNFEMLVAKVEMATKLSIDVHTVSVKRFYSYMKALEEQTKNVDHGKEDS